MNSEDQFRNYTNSFIKMKEISKILRDNFKYEMEATIETYAVGNYHFVLMPTEYYIVPKKTEEFSSNYDFRKLADVIADLSTEDSRPIIYNIDLFKDRAIKDISI